MNKVSGVSETILKGIMCHGSWKEMKNSPLQQKIFAELMAKNFINLVTGIINLEIQKPQTGKTQRNPCHGT